VPTAASAAPLDPVQRALPLLDARLRPGQPGPMGYVDLLRDDPPASTGMTQDLMLTGIVPAVYERWWRPALGRLAKGLLGPGMDDELRIARGLLGLRHGDGVLDVACGPGNFTRHFAHAVGPEGLAVGIDASATMLGRAIADTAQDNIAYVRGDAVRLPFRGASFDAVCCFAALHLFAEPFEALDHMVRVLTPGGRIAIFTSCRAASAPIRAWQDLVAARSGMRMFERGEITGALAARGLVDVECRTSGLTQFVGGTLPA
jgi:SAM-dependent methyltransferase